MPIPDYQTLMLPVLQAFAEGAQRVADILPTLQKRFDVTDEEAQELIPSGRVTVLSNRAHWARTYLSKAGCLESPKRNVHVLTDRGRDLLASNPTRIDNSVLKEFDEFENWRRSSISEGGFEGGKSPVSAGGVGLPDDPETPEDAMARLNGELNASLSADLIDAILGITPARFEKLIVDLLIAMGYGGGGPCNGEKHRSLRRWRYRRSHQ